MEIRPAEPADSTRIREIAEHSFRSSYSLSPQGISIVLDEVFSDAALSDRIDDPEVHLLVAEADVEGVEDVQGFVDLVDDDEATLRWLHVHPDARGQGVATSLMERVQETVEEGTPLRATMLAEAVEGAEFLTGFGLERTDSEEVEYGEERYMLDVFTAGVEGEEAEDPNEPTVAVPETVEVEGRELHLDSDNAIPGRDAPFFSLYTDADESEPFGYFCSQCGSVDVSADGLDRLACNECGNLHKAEEWDGSFL